MKCPEGPTWFASEKLYVKREQEECSGIGRCVDGMCQCPSGFSGPSCGVLKCPINDKKQVCNNHGICVRISEGNGYSNWDKNSTYGCKCDAGYKGSDCSVSIYIIYYWFIVGSCVKNLDPKRTYKPSRQIYKLESSNNRRSLDSSPVTVTGTFSFSAEYLL